MAGAVTQIQGEDRTASKQQKGCADSRRALTRRFHTISDSYRLRFVSSFKTERFLNKHTSE